MSGGQSHRYIFSLHLSLEIRFEKPQRQTNRSSNKICRVINSDNDIPE